MPSLTCCGKPEVSNKIAKVSGISDTSVHLFKKLLRLLMIQETSRKLSSIAGCSKEFYDSQFHFTSMLNSSDFGEIPGLFCGQLRSSDLSVARSLLDDVHFYQILLRFFLISKDSFGCSLRKSILCAEITHFSNLIIL